MRKMAILGASLLALQAQPGAAQESPAAATDAPAMTASAAGSARTGPERRFTGADLFDLSIAADPQISPDGRRIAYVRRANDIMSDRAVSSIWLIDTQTGTETPLAVGRPARRKGAAGAPRERGLFAGRGVDQPDAAHRAVGHDVVRAADIGDVAAVGADLRIGGDRQVEQVGAGEAPFGRRARAADRRRRGGGRDGCGFGGCGRRVLRGGVRRGEGEQARTE